MSKMLRFGARFRTWPTSIASVFDFGQPVKSASSMTARAATAVGSSKRCALI